MSTGRLLAAAVTAVAALCGTLAPSAAYGAAGGSATATAGSAIGDSAAAGSATGGRAAADSATGGRAAADSATGSRAAAGAKRTTVTVDTKDVLGATSKSYIGLTFESGTLNSGQYDNVGDLARLLANLGAGIMRFGGTSVDESYSTISPSALAGLVRLADASGWSVQYSEDLGHYNAARVQSDAAAVATALGRHLAALACGNEPNAYYANGIRTPTYTEADYAKQVAACYARLRAAAPLTPLEGPDDFGDPGFLGAFAKQDPGKVAWLTEHIYPMRCVGEKVLDGVTPAEFDAELLSPGLAAREYSGFGYMLADAKTAHASLHITETNSACGGGLAGGSDSYATALWVIDYLLIGAERGVAGFNFSGGLGPNCAGYTVLCQTGDHEWTGNPIYYGLLFTRKLGTGHLVKVTVKRPANSGFVTAFALKPPKGTGLRVMVENLSSSHSSVSLRVGGHPAAATVLRMTEPPGGLTATSDVRIQGAKLAANGTLKPGAPATVRCSGGVCPVSLTPESAALITIR
jgi:hypothetical protein